jgi:hypothetical protein
MTRPAGLSGNGKMSIEDPAAVRGAAMQIQDSGQEIAAIGAKVDLAQQAARALPGADVAKACGRLEADVKNLLEYHGRWPVEVGGDVLAAVDQISRQDDENSSHLHIPL